MKRHLQNYENYTNHAHKISFRIKILKNFPSDNLTIIRNFMITKHKKAMLYRVLGEVFASVINYGIDIFE